MKSKRKPTRGAGRSIELAALLVITAVVMAGCGSKGEQKAATGTTGSAEAAEAPVPPAVVTQASWAPEALEELLAPIALYPDQLVGQILAASVNPQEVLDAGNWLLENQDLKAGFGPACAPSSSSPPWST